MSPWLAAVVLQAAALLPMHTIARGPQSGIAEPRQAVVRTAGEWTDLWRAHAPGRERPAVDFDRDMVVGVFLGSRPTAGFGVEIVGVREEGGATVVQYRETRPARGAITAQIVTAPFHLVSIPRQDGPVRFERLE